MSRAATKCMVEWLAMGAVLVLAGAAIVAVTAPLAILMRAAESPAPAFGGW